MKSKSLFLAVIFIIAIAVNSIAQTQPTNGGFENWISVGPSENPTGWSSFNDFYMYGIPEMSFKTTDAHTGQYAVRLISDTATIPPPLGTNTLDTIAGYVFLGTPDMNNPGIAYTERPELMQAYVKGTLATGGYCYIIAGLRKWNAGTQSRDMVGQAVYFMDASVASYTMISVSFNYTLPDTPDTLEIKIMAGDLGPGGIIMPGNEFFVDDLTFTFPVKIDESANNSQDISVFPNPVINRLSIGSPSEINAIEIHNMIGGIVYSSIITESKNQIVADISDFVDGIYIVRIYTKKETFTKRIVKK